MDAQTFFGKSTNPGCPGCPVKVPCNVCKREVWCDEDTGYGCICYKCQEASCPMCEEYCDELISCDTCGSGACEECVEKEWRRCFACPHDHRSCGECSCEDWREYYELNFDDS